VHTDLWKTEGLKQALDLHGFDAAFGGARRDEEKSRAKERMFSFRTASTAGTRRTSARALAPVQRRKRQGRVDPRVPAVELDRARRLAVHPPRERIPIVPLYFAAERPGGRARRHADHGRRRAHAAASPAKPR
jgi:sulfate adenylyltransferase subunit 2